MKCIFMLALVLTVFPVAAAESESLNAFCLRYGFPSPSYKSDTLTFRSSYTEMVFRDDSRMLKFNGVLVWMLAGAEKDRKAWRISKPDRDAVLAPLLRGVDFTAGRSAPRLVLIDPGHGGAQTGAKTTGGVYEKDLVLDIARRISVELGRRGIKSALTRDRDVELSLDSRSGMIGELGADLFISVHLNSAGNMDASGIESYLVPAEGYPSTAGGTGSTARVVGNRNDALNQLLAYLVHRDLCRSTGGLDRGVKRARFDVISGATCPAVLLECGFMSNSAESSRLQQEAYREMIAIGAATGIRCYFSLWKQQSGGAGD